jgi:hypothetical protein
MTAAMANDLAADIFVSSGLADFTPAYGIA